MAKRIQLSDQEKALVCWNDILSRFSNRILYRNNNRIILCEEDTNIIFIAEEKLFEELLKDESIKEFDINDISLSSLRELFDVSEKLNNDKWLELGDLDTLLISKSVDIEVDSRDYPITINKNFLPIKLKKAEYKHLYYQIMLNPLIIAFKKSFELSEGYSFSVLRIYQIV